MGGPGGQGVIHTLPLLDNIYMVNNIHSHVIFDVLWQHETKFGVIVCIDGNTWVARVDRGNIQSTLIR